MSTRKKKLFIIKTAGLISLLLIISFVVFQASKIKPANAKVANDKKEFLKTFQDVKLIEQEVEADSKKETPILSYEGNDLNEDEKALLKEIGIVEEIIPNFKRYTAKQLLSSGFISTFTTYEEQESFLELYGDEEYFINIKSQMVVLKNGREIDGVLTYQRPTESDDKATPSNNVYPKFTLSKIDTFKLKLTLKYPDDSTSRQYKINNEDKWQDYQTPITIEENVTIQTRYKFDLNSDYTIGNSKIISDLRLSKPTYTFSKTDEIGITSYNEKIKIVRINFQKRDKLSGVVCRYSYSINGSDFSEEMEGDSFDITELGTYIIKLRTVIEDKNVNDSIEQQIVFTYDGEKIYNDNGNEIYNNEAGQIDSGEKLSNNITFSGLSITTDASDYIDLDENEIKELNNGQTIEKEVAYDTKEVTIKGVPEETTSVIVGNIKYLMTESSMTVKLKIIAENGDSKQVSIKINKKSEDSYGSSYGSYGYGGVGRTWRRKWG